MVTEVVMTVWIRLVQGSEKVKDQDVDEAHGNSEGVYYKGWVPHVENVGNICVYMCRVVSLQLIITLTRQGIMNVNCTTTISTTCTLTSRSHLEK